MPRFARLSKASPGFAGARATITPTRGAVWPIGAALAAAAAGAAAAAVLATSVAMWVRP